ncbi:MAG: hypothetical protein HQL70_09400 [Magnetococcales bacterium]|nr:hypothetical protein [Magnetococcales bacterium]
MNYLKPITHGLLILIFIASTPFAATASDILETLQLPPTPLRQINELLKKREMAKEQIKITQLKARTLISRAQRKLEESRQGAKNSDKNLKNSWENSATSLSDLAVINQQYHDNKKAAKIAQETMREVYLLSESRIVQINEQIAMIEHEIESIRAEWTNKHGAQVLDVARQTKDQILKVKNSFTELITRAQQKVNREQAALLAAENNLRNVNIIASNKTQKTLNWVAEKQNSVKQAVEKSGESWHISRGSYGDIQSELDLVTETKDQARLAISQAKVIGGLIAADVAIAQAKVESQKAKLNKELRILASLQAKSEMEIGVYNPKQNLINNLTTLVRGPVQYNN